jgi:hypothetical protein
LRSSGSAKACSQSKSVKPKMRKRKLKSGVNWQWALKQKGVKQTGVKEVLSDLGSCIQLI